MSNSPPNPVSSSDSFPDDRPRSDIPPARRQPAEIPLHEIERASAQPTQKARSRSGLLLGSFLLASAAGIGLWQWNRLAPNAPALVSLKQTWQTAVAKAGIAQPSSASSPPSAKPAPSESASAIAQSDPEIAITERSAESTAASDTSAQQPTRSLTQPEETAEKTDTLLNHRRYDEASVETLVPLNPNSTLKLQPAAQQAVIAMLAKARAEGVQLGVISAFRTVEDQNHLYFQIKAERGQNAETRAKVSAPPGYSEHHTGYAIDFIDESRLDTQLNQSFETTAAYQWLDKNAAFFNFELSFPKDESSGVSYEPWHWRYVGDQKSLELFYKE